MFSPTAPRKLFLLLLAAVALGVTPAIGNAANLFQDLFAYPNGALTSNGGWYAHSGAAAKAILVSAGAITLQQSAGSGEDVNHPFGPLAAGDKTYASFTLRVPSGSVMGANDYFIHFRPAAADSNNFVTRTFVGPPTAGGDYVLGVAAGSLTTTPVAPWATGLAFNTTYQVVVAYDGVTGTSQLWVDPVNEASTSVSSASAPLAGRLLASIAVRQASPAGATSSQVIDNVVVGTAFPAQAVPSTTTWGLAALASLLVAAGGVLAVRRRNLAV